MIEIQVSTKALKAMAMFGSRDETRYVLCVVRLEWDAEGNLLLVATDGRMLATLRLDEDAGHTYGKIIKSDDLPPIDAGAILIPRDAVKEAVSIPKKPDRWTDEDGDEFDADERQDRRWLTLQIEDNRITFRYKTGWTLSCNAVEGNYPNWRGAIPKGESSPIDGSLYSARFMGRLCRAAKLLSNENDFSIAMKGHRHETAPEPVTSLYIPSAPGFYAVLMPVRVSGSTDNPCEIPSWVKGNV